MATLYELKGAWEQVYGMACDGEIDIDVTIDTLEAIEGEIEDKADGYAKLLRSLGSDVAALKEEEKRIADRRRAIENKAEAIKKRLQEVMEETGKVKFATQLFSFNIQKNPPSVVIDNPDEVPQIYLVPQEPKADKKMILELLKGGEQPSWAHLEQSQSLRIR